MIRCTGGFRAAALLLICGCANRPEKLQTAKMPAAIPANAHKRFAPIVAFTVSDGVKKNGDRF